MNQQSIRVVQITSLWQDAWRLRAFLFEAGEARAGTARLDPLAHTGAPLGGGSLEAGAIVARARNQSATDAGDLAEPHRLVAKAAATC
jgi:hypothetical protein